MSCLDFWHKKVEESDKRDPISIKKNKIEKEDNFMKLALEQL